MSIQDTIYVYAQIPDMPPAPEHGWYCTSSDLDCRANEYAITADGRLIDFKVHYESVPDEERLYYGTPEWDESALTRLAGCIRPVRTAEFDTAYHGDIHFFLGDIATSGDYSSFVARFTHGQLEYIHREVYP